MLTVIWGTVLPGEEIKVGLDLLSWASKHDTGQMNTPFQLSDLVLKIFKIF